ncbi:TPA: hypothetical protein KQF10_002491 [Clostridioides difficile]|nr:hypothetical protein [Clostridioides difficile]
MLGFRKKDSKDLFKTVAHKHGISVSEVKEQMRFSIEQARNNPDPIAQAEFQKLFGDRTPTPEEFICTVSKKLKY